MNDNLREATLQGRTDLLYAEIEANPSVLDDIDKISFVETPLHLAASSGQLSFATEIMRLKPSFARKLNPRGLSPMHLATKEKRYRMVRRFVEIDGDLVRVKGKDGITPLHMVSQAGEIELLAEFLSVCPKSIRDVTNQNENALHVAVKSEQFHVVDFLVRWLQCNSGRDAADLQKSTLNWKDEAGDTILHILVRLDDPDPQIVKLLIRCKIDLKAKNLNEFTALDIVESRRQNLNNNIIGILVNAGASRGASVTSPTLAESLPKNITFLEDFAIKVFRNGASITDSNRNALLAAAALVGTMTFQASQSPPGGLFQVDSEKGSLIHNSTETSTKIYAGKSVLGTGPFAVFWIVNTTALLFSIVAILALLPSQRFSVTTLVSAPVTYFGLIYFMSMSVISPNPVVSGANGILLFSIVPLFVFANAVGVVILRRLDRYFRKNWEIESRFSPKEN